MDPTEVDDVLDQVFLLDVREPYEWQVGHVAEAVHIPMGMLNARIDELPRDQHIVCVCKSGGRSQAVADALNRAGYRASNLDGGLHAWETAGLSIVTDAGAPGSVA